LEFMRNIYSQLFWDHALNVSVHSVFFPLKFEQNFKYIHKDLSAVDDQTKV